MKRTVMEYIAACCRGAAQVMLQRSLITGVLFLTAILAGGWQVSALAVISLMFATITCGAGRAGYADGLWGFNALLVGCAASVFPCSNDLLLAIVVYLTIPLKQYLDKCFAGLGISSLTLPFILATWIFIAISHWHGAGRMFEYIVSVDNLLITVPDIVAGVLKGLSQVFLVDSWVGGVLIFAGLMVANPGAAIWALVGSAVGMACATICGCSWLDISNGLWGFSPALTAIAIGVTFNTERILWRRILITSCAVLLTFAIQFALTPVLAAIGVPALTLPFCVATWISVAVRGLMIKK